MAHCNHEPASGDRVSEAIIPSSGLDNDEQRLEKTEKKFASLCSEVGTGNCATQVKPSGGVENSCTV
jgi:hypothetical protein